MPNERRIEKLLRAFAKKRKADAGAPLEMHPATRRLLQGEVARRTKARPATEQAWWRFWFGTPRRAFAVCALMSVIISGTVFLTTMKPTKPSMDLAKNENAVVAGEPQAKAVSDREIQPAPAVSAPAPEVPAPVSPPPVTVAMADRKDADTGLERGGGGGAGGFGGSTGFGPATTAPAANASAPPIAYDYIATNGATATFALNEPVGQALDKAKVDSTVAMQKDVSSTTFDGLPANREPAGTSAAAPALDAEKQFAEAKAPQSTTLNFAGGGSRFENMDALKANGTILAQQFYRLRATDGAAEDMRDKSRALGAVKKLSAGDVLDSFSVTQDGDKITVVDSDGSQYSGFIQPVTVSGALADMPVAATATAPGQMTPTRRATGTLTSAGAYNSVTFDSGTDQNYAFKVTGTNLSLKQLVVFSGNFVALTNGVVTRNGLVTNAVATDLSGLQPGLQNSKIEGRAAVGKKTEVKIEAAPMGP